MNDKPIIFAIAMPNPEILPDEAKAAGAFIVATGRSDLPNHINPCLATPGMIRCLLDTRASDVTLEMKLEAAYAIARDVKPEYLSPGCILPNPMCYDIPNRVNYASSKMAMEQGVMTKEVKVAKNNMLHYFADAGMK